MTNRPTPYIENYDMLYITQFGFRKDISTEGAILEFIDNEYNSIIRSQHFAEIVIDLPKDFEMVNHDIFLLKLFHFGFRGITHDRFKSYLSNRV